jgi:hypothetical protein
MAATGKLARIGSCGAFRMDCTGGIDGPPGTVAHSSAYPPRFYAKDISAMEQLCRVDVVCVCDVSSGKMGKGKISVYAFALLRCIMRHQFDFAFTHKLYLSMSPE